MALAAPHGVLKAQRVVIDAEDASDGGKSRREAFLLDMVFADCPATELANGPGLLLTMNALHRDTLTDNAAKPGPKPPKTNEAACLLDRQAVSNGEHAVKESTVPLLAKVQYSALHTVEDVHV